MVVVAEKQPASATARPTAATQLKVGIVGSILAEEFAWLQKSSTVNSMGRVEEFSNFAGSVKVTLLVVGTGSVGVLLRTRW